MPLFRSAIAVVRFTLLWSGGAACVADSIKPLEVTGEKPGFTRMLETGIAFTNLLARSRSLTNSILLNGSGVAAGDVDGDGLCDLYFCALDGPNHLFRNRGSWKFEEATGANGAACANMDATGAAFADLDRDGDLDLVVNSVKGGAHVFFNDGKGRFSEVQVLNPGKGGMSIALADVNGDGFLDLYIANYRASALMDLPETRLNFKKVNGKTVIDTVNGRPASDPEYLDRFYINELGRIMEAGEADALFLNKEGKFTPVSWTGGAFLDENGKPLERAPLDWGLSAIFHDLNGDGLPDLYVCNDFDSPDRVWINQGGGKFRAFPLGAIGHTSLFSMGVDVADINRDGRDDIFVLDMLSRDHRRRMTTLPDRSNSFEREGMRPQYMMNTLQLARDDGTYAEIAQFSGVAAAEWAWAAIFIDVDLDGYEDLLITNGNEADGRDYDASEKIKAIRASKQLTYQERMELRRMFRKLDTPNAAFRNRGDLTFEDASAAWGFAEAGVAHGMCLADLDNDGDMDVVINNLNAPATLLRNNCPEPRVAVRLAGGGIGARIKVIGGPMVQTQEMIAGGRYLSSDQAQRTFAAGEKVDVEVRWASGKVSRITNVLANSLCEVSEERAGREAGASPRSSVLPLFREIDSAVAYDDAAAAGDEFALQPTLPKRVQRGVHVSWLDLNGDGWLDLAVGKTGFANLQGNGFQRLAPSATNRLAAGRCIPGKYPLAEPSMFEGKQISTGIVNGFAVADLNGDGQEDLLLAREWAPLRVFLRENGKLVDATEKLGLGQYKGWWNAVATGDFNGDGLGDVVAANWGRNNRYASGPLSPAGPALSDDIFLYSLDADGDGVFELIEAHLDPAQQKIVPWRNLDVLGKAVPSIRERFPTHAAYAAASVEDLLGEKFAQAKRFDANCLDSMLFLNRGDHFEARPLPTEAQLAPALGVCAADFNGDGKQDIFLAQNFFGAQPETPRSDAGTGLILIGDGAGNFRALSPLESGIHISGEMRGCAAADFDKDGRIDLAVVGGDGRVRLFKNAAQRVSK